MNKYMEPVSRSYVHKAPQEKREIFGTKLNQRT